MYIGNQVIDQSYRLQSRPLREIMVTQDGVTSVQLPYDPAFRKVYLNGGLMSEVDYTAVDGTNIVFDEPLGVNDVVAVDSASRFMISGSLPSSNPVATGRLGVNVAVPAYTIHADDAVSALRFLVGSSLVSETGLVGFENANGPAVRLGGSATSLQGSLVLESGGAQRVFLTSAGRVGVGVAAPAAALDVSGPRAGNVYAVAALDVDCSKANYFKKTIAANSALTFSNAPASRSYEMVLEVQLDGGAITWPASVRWPGGVAPSLTAGKTHLFRFTTSDGGTRWWGDARTDYAN